MSRLAECICSSVALNLLATPPADTTPPPPPSAPAPTLSGCWLSVLRSRKHAHKYSYSWGVFAIALSPSPRPPLTLSRGHFPPSRPPALPLSLACVWDPGDITSALTLQIEADNEEGYSVVATHLLNRVLSIVCP